jgi:mediator of RNA polymerase II transcription subunit 14
MYMQEMAVPPTPLTDAEVIKTLSDMEETIRYRLRMTEIFPVEMSQHHIGELKGRCNPSPFLYILLLADGRVHFNVPKLFITSLCLRGSSKDDGWFCVHVEFLINICGDLTGLQGLSFLELCFDLLLVLVEFPRTPTGAIKRHITDEADVRLALYLPIPADQPPIPDVPPRPQLPQDVVDAPLIRLYNFLRMSFLLFSTTAVMSLITEMMSLSYQLEILWYQVFKSTIWHIED